jgi:hypothetical protein
VFIKSGHGLRKVEKHWSTTMYVSKPAIQFFVMWLCQVLRKLWNSVAIFIYLFVIYLTTLSVALPQTI